MYPFLNEHNIHMAIGKSLVSLNHLLVQHQNSQRLRLCLEHMHGVILLISTTIFCYLNTLFFLMRIQKS